MSPGRDRPPVLLRLAVWLLPADVRDEVLGELVEHWRTDVRGRSWAARIHWLGRQPLAAATARVRFGGGGAARARLQPGRRWHLGFSWLDVKLGLRMMRKHPGVSAVIVFALMLGIPASLAPHHLIDSFFGVSPPFVEGERVLSLIPVGPDAAPLRLGDYERLRERLTTFEAIGAVISDDLNVITSEDGGARGERGAHMTASSFSIARVAPLMGRVLLPADEADGAPGVVVVGHDFWRERLGGDPTVVGTTLRIAGEPTTVVGVMPDGFSMPSTERLWLPLRLRSIDYDGLGPPVQVYGRLADGVSAGEARAEVSAVGGRPAPAGGDAREALRVDAAAFSALEVGQPRGSASVLLFAAQALPLVLLLITCGNVAILLLARTAGRTGEVAVRTALGASRARIAGQLFVEALLLALLATGLGLLALDMIIGRIEPLVPLPFWADLGVGPELVAKALGLAVLSAVVGGVVPALRATGTHLHRTLQGAGGGGATLRFGPFVGALVVVEVGLGVSALFAGGLMGNLFRPNPGEAVWTPEAGRYLAASISMERPPGDVAAADRETRRARLAETQGALARRLSAEPGVRGWAFSDAPPGEEREERRVRVDGDGGPPDWGGLPGVATYVDPSFFAVLGVRPVAGRLLGPGDVPPDPTVEPLSVVVNRKFLERREMEPGLSIGRRVRFTNGGNEAPGAWMEIVGVVPDIEASVDRVFFDGTPVLYLAVTPGTLASMSLLIDLGSEPGAFTPRLRTILAETDPTAILESAEALDEVGDDEATLWRWAPSAMVGLSMIAIVLSMAALYALMSFTVAQRTREIGIRVALGGKAGRVVGTVARRALGQLALGVTLGAGFWTVLLARTVGIGGADSADELAKSLAGWPLLLLATTGVVIAIGAVACLAPVLRGLRVSPMEALRAEG